MALIGLVFILGGLFALFNPLAATLTAEQIAAWLFVLGGIMQLVAAVRTGGWGARLLNAVLALAYLWLGISLLANPLAGVLTLTVLVAIVFLVNGATKLLLALTMRGTPFLWPTAVSGAISLLLALMVFSNFPQSAALLLGVLLAVELVSSGVMILAFALFVRGSGTGRGEV
ncbi:MAG: HdeD family acid-resistance protein [Rhodovulum sp.]